MTTTNLKEATGLQLQLLSIRLAVCRLPADASIPDWATKGEFFAIVRTSDELSVVCTQSELLESVQREADWRCFKVQGPLDFSLTGVLASLAAPLADAKVSIFAISTFDTDYLLVKENVLEEAKRALTRAGHAISEERKP